MPRKKTGVATKFIPPEPVDDDDVELEALEIEGRESITDNALSVPLFADIDGRTSRSISQLRLLKLEQGGMAYKGMIPVSSTYDTIGQIYGDGIYTIEGLNNRGTALHVKDNIRIALGGNEAGSDKVTAPVSVDSDRIERLARASAMESQENNRAFIQMLIATTQQQAQREREFVGAQQEQMRVFFASLMTMQNTQYQQTIAMMTASHNATLQSLQATNERNPRSDGTELVQTLIQGLQLGADMSEGRGGAEEPPVWQSILQNGLGVLAKVGGNPGNAADPNTSVVQTASATAPTSKLTAAQKRTIKEALLLHREVRKRGIDPRGLAQQLSEAGENPTLADRIHASKAEVERPSPEETDDSDDEDELDDSDDEFEDDLDDESDADESDEPAGVGAANQNPYS